jgi:hypothetical protein
MDPSEIQENFPALDRAAEDVLSLLSTEFMKPTGSHVETVISAAASLAGLSVLRNRSFDLHPYKPGMIVDYDPGRDIEEIRIFMMAEAGKAGLNPSGGWGMEIPEAHRPKFSIPEMTRDQERKFIAVCDRHKLKRVFYPYVAVLAALKFVYASDRTRLLDQNTGKALILYYLVAGAKTVPYFSFS